MLAAVLIGLAYLCGSLPIGVWVGRRMGVDVRIAGSGNIGATNVARTAGRGAGLLTLLGDMAKGLVPAALARFMLIDPWLVALTGLAAVGGHLFSAFLRFSGGKGVATAFGVFIVLTPMAAALSAVVFALTAFSTRYVSLASILATLALPLLAVVWEYAAPLAAAAAVVAVIVVLRHRDNISRLRRGVEPRFGVGRRVSP